MIAVFKQHNNASQCYCTLAYGYLIYFRFSEINDGKRHQEVITNIYDRI